MSREAGGGGRESAKQQAPAIAMDIDVEVGQQRLTFSGFGLDAELGLAVDVTGTGDLPNGRKMEVALGDGAAIKVRDGGMIADPRLKDLLVQRAQEGRIKAQLEVLEAGTTDASSMQNARGGLPVGAVSIPCRHIHTPSEVVDFRDVQACVNLLVEFLQKPIEL